MASRRTIAGCFMTILTAGVVPPAVWQQDGEAAQDQTVGVWALLFGDVSDQQLEAAVLSWLRQPASRFWPTPGQIVEVLDRQSGQPRPDADAAYGRLLHQVRRHGLGRGPVTPGVYAREHESVERPMAPLGAWHLSDDPAEERAVWAGLAAIGGWGSLCLSAEGDQAMAAQFRRAYDEESTRARHTASDARIFAAIAARPAPQLGQK